ncbi:LolA family protein [Halorientalis salina]|uniref:LolA family protein n=1 Tax=Halorientalis salina TaxID=2932266 RepID=UPI0010AD241C|nr:outer membrane lipoprotein carrier protein LolA [Halorientalis salina]
MRPDTETPTAILAATVVVGFLAVAFIAFVPAGESADNRSLFGDRATERITTLDGVNATVETVIEHGNETSRTVERVSLRPATSEYRSAHRNESGRQWDLRVSNGSVLWLYDSDENEAKKIERTAARAGNSTRTDRLERLVQRLARDRATDTASTPTPGVRPLPAVPHGASGESAITKGAGGGSAFDVTYVGNATVDGRAAYHVRIQSRSTGESAVVRNYTQQLWLDTEYFYPVKRQTSWRQNGSRTVITTIHRDVVFNPGLDDALFAFDPPANATVDEEDDHTQWTYGSIAALQAAAPMSVPIPEVPRSYELAVATRTNVPGRVRSVGLKYANATAQLSVSKSNLTWYDPRTESEPVTVGDQQGEFRNLGPEQTVSWTCDGWEYSVSGRGVSKSLLLDVAESVSCD